MSAFTYVGKLWHLDSPWPAPLSLEDPFQPIATKPAKAWWNPFWTPVGDLNFHSFPCLIFLSNQPITTQRAAGSPASLTGWVAEWSKAVVLKTTVR